MAHVLVIDDDDETRAAISECLDLEGYHVHTVPDGQSGIDFIHQSVEHLIVIIDWLMPGMDGVAVLETIAMDASLAAQHDYILMSASAHRPDFLMPTFPTTMHVTVVGKPFNLDHLLTTVRAAAERLDVPVPPRPTC
jgi:CheY-like chemotaxis protein